MPAMQVTIYGSDTDLGKKTLLSNLSSTPKVTLNIKGAYASPEDDFKELKFPNAKIYLHKEVQVFNIETLPIDYPTAATTIDSFFFSDILKAKYIYLDLMDYLIKPVGLLDTEAIKVLFKGRSVKEGDGTKSVTLNLEIA